MRNILAATALTVLLAASTTSAQPVIGGMKMANPASQYCLSIGGRLERRNGPAGEYSLCVIDEWKLFRATHSANMGR